MREKNTHHLEQTSMSLKDDGLKFFLISFCLSASMPSQNNDTNMSTIPINCVSFPPAFDWYKNKGIKGRKSEGNKNESKIYPVTNFK